MIKLKIWGGAGEHGRSAYLLSGSEFHLLLDCGVKKEGTGEYPLIEPEIVPHLDAVLLSHAHEDHSVAIPLLYKMGYQGEVWTTRETREQLRTYFANWRRFTERVGEKLPYDEADEQAIRYRYLDDEVLSQTWFELIPQVQLMWGRSGHLAGSVWFGVQAEGKKIWYSGDYTSESLLLQDDCPGEAWKGANDGDVPLLDLAIMDAAYGTDQETQADQLMQLEEEMRQTLDLGGKIMLPLPAVGRGQDLMIWIQEHLAEVPLVIEEKLLVGMKRLAVACEWLKPSLSGAQASGCTPRETIEAFLHNKNWISPRSNTERMELLSQEQPLIWLVQDGMMQSTPSRWLYEQMASDSRNLVLLTGHVSKDTFGYRLLEQPEQYGKCRVRKIRYKVHQGYADVSRMMTRVPALHQVLIHAPKGETDRLMNQLARHLATNTRQIHSMVTGEELWI